MEYKTKEQIKDEYAKENGYDDWFDFHRARGGRLGSMDIAIDTIMELYAKECLKKAADEVTLNKKLEKRIGILNNK